MTDAWTIASIDFQTNQVRTGFILLALLGNDKLSRILQDVTLEFRKISLEDLRKGQSPRPPGRNTKNISRRILL
jgi:type VI secretion system protein VasG